MTDDYDEWEYDEQPEAAPARQRLAGHRGVLILVLGILGLVSCPLLGIFAWVMGNNDLAEIRAGRMDPAGEDLTQAGRVCGIVATVLALAGVAVFLFFALVVGASSFTVG